MIKWDVCVVIFQIFIPKNAYAKKTHKKGGYFR